MQIYKTDDFAIVYENFFVVNILIVISNIKKSSTNYF